MRLNVWFAIFCWISASAQVSDNAVPTSPPAAASTSPVASAPTAPTPQRRVTAFISATDRSGNPVRDLAKDQVSVLDNSQAGQILEVRAARELPLDLAIVLLASKTSFPQQQAAAVELVHKVLRPNIDHAFVVVDGRR